MLFINFSRCHSFDSADIIVRNANDKSDLIRECENSIKHFGKINCQSYSIYSKSVCPIKPDTFTEAELIIETEKSLSNILNSKKQSLGVVEKTINQFEEEEQKIFILQFRSNVGVRQTKRQWPVHEIYTKS